MIQQTSREAFNTLKPILGAMQWEVLETLAALGTANDREIARKLRMYRNSTIPRRKELVEKGLVKEAFKDKDLVTNRTTIYWTLTRKGYQAISN